jgi:hypothetical protein
MIRSLCILPREGSSDVACRFPETALRQGVSAGAGGSRGGRKGFSGLVRGSASEPMHLLGRRVIDKEFRRTYARERGQGNRDKVDRRNAI